MSDEFETLTFNTVYTTTVDQIDTRSEAYATIKIQPFPNRTTNLRGKADTGAQGNILPMRTFKNIYPHRVNEAGRPTNAIQSETKLTAYNGTEIPQYGKISIPCLGKDGEWYNTKFFITTTAGSVIFGLPTCTELGLVAMNCQITQSIPDVMQTDNRIINSAEQLRAHYPNRFEGLGKFPGKHHLVIDKKASPVIHAPRRAPIQLRENIKKELDRMQAIGVIRPVDQPTDWVSSITYVRKADGSMRICLDPKDVNVALKRGQHHTPTLEELTHRFARAKVFSKLDAKSGYWSVQLDEESQLLTTFNSPFGRFCFCRLPFGLKISQDVFQKAMDHILGGLKGVVSIADDITVYGEGDTMEEAQRDHNRNLHNLMAKAEENNLVFQFNKCKINESEIKFFGNIYGRDGARPDPDKVKAIKELLPPTDQKELQSFLGMITYLAPYIPNLSEKTTPLRVLLHKSNEFQWHHEQQQAFEAIIHSICEAGTLTYFDPSKPTVIKVDASRNALGAALTQQGRPVAYASKSLSETESRYANIERELLACVFGAERFHTYVFGQSFTIESDHKPLEMISKKNLSATPARLQRMLLRLQKYDVNIKYLPGKDMSLPDSLSRMPKRGKDPEVDLNIQVCFVQFSTPKLRQLRSEIEKDDEMAALMSYIIQGFPDHQRSFPQNIRKYWPFRDLLTIEDGLILKGEQIIIPNGLRKEYLQRIHQGHQGITRCQQRARSSVYWPGINDDIQDLIDRCSTCQTYQASQPREPLHAIIPELPKVPWHTLGSDMFQLDGKNYLVLADYYSNFIIVEPMTNTTSKAIAHMTNKYISILGIPNTIISDNGPQFIIGTEYQKMVNELGIVHITSSPHHAKSHGFVESAVKTAQLLIKKSPNSVDMALLLHRATPRGPGQKSPAEMLFNRKLGHNLPIHTAANDDDGYRRREEMANNNTESRYNQHAHQLSELYMNQAILFQDVAKRTWSPGQIIGVGPEPRSYTIECRITGRKLRRNRVMIRPRQSSISVPTYHYHMAHPGPINDSPSNKDTCENVTPEIPPAAELIPANDAIPPITTPRRSTRQIKPPIRYNSEEFIRN